MDLERQPPLLRRKRGRKHLWLAGALVLAWVGVWWWPSADDEATPPGGPVRIMPTGQKDSALFGLGKLHQANFTVSAGEWEVLQRDTVAGRGGRGGGGFVGMAGLEPMEDDDNDYVRESDGRQIHRGGGFGGLFPWVRGDLQAGDALMPDVGLRYKGNASYSASQNQLRRNLKVKTDFFGKAPGLEGEKTLDFNAGAMDSSRIRESLSYAAFRAAGVPAPRTAYVEVTLTVPRLYDKEYVGLYTLVEQVNKSFAKEFLPGKTGLLLKPEGVSGGITYYGEDWSAYTATYRPDREATPEEARSVIDFARLVARADDDEFHRKLTAHLDVDEFLRYLAVNALLANLDSYLNGRHNFFLYLNPEDHRFMFVPWDQDLSLGGFGGRGGNSGAILDLSLLHPHSGQNRLIERTLAIPEYKDRYLAIIRQLVATSFSKEALLKTITDLEAVNRDALARETRAMRIRGESPGGTGFGGMMGRGVNPRTFVEQRLASVQRQLEGKSDGTIPSGLPGGGGRGGGGFPGQGRGRGN